MALLRAMHAAEMPDPGKLAKRLEDIAANAGTAAPAAGGSPGSPAPSASLDWKALVEKVDHKGLMTLAAKMRLQVRVVELVPGKLTYALAKGFKDDISPELRDGLLQLTGERWQVERVDEEGAPTLVEAQEAVKAAEENRVMNTPIVKAAFDAFPEAELVEEDNAAVGGRNWSR
jgi:DNA polymerase-3 subunit gamma/tau